MITTINEFRKINENSKPSKPGHFGEMARAGVFGIDEDKFQGWTFEDDWNGFAVPYFEKEAADQIVKTVNSVYGTENNVYDAETDTYDFKDEECKFAGIKIMTTDGEKHVYPIGAYSWTWMEN